MNYRYDIDPCFYDNDGYMWSEWLFRYYIALNEKDERTESEKRVLFIRKYGERCKMLKTTYTVLCVDDRQYWTMGDPMNTTWVLNRSLIDDPRRIPKLEWLDRILLTEV